MVVSNSGSQVCVAGASILTCLSHLSCPTEKYVEIFLRVEGAYVLIPPGLIVPTRWILSHGPHPYLSQVPTFVLLPLFKLYLLSSQAPPTPLLLSYCTMALAKTVYRFWLN